MRIRCSVSLFEQRWKTNNIGWAIWKRKQQKPVYKNGGSISMKINAQYLELKDSYLFATVNRKVREYQAAHPDKKVIKLGIGDVTIPLCGAVT